MRSTTLAALLLTALAHGALAQTAGDVEGLQMPAWLERGAIRLPLRAGAEVRAGDLVRTGAGARVLLRLAEGSHVKLGEDAEFRVREFEPPEASDGLFSGFLDVVKGAFRFTTTALSQGRRRDIDVRVAAVTAGIRGTDLWGKAAPDRDIVCLIEGEISVQRGADAPITMSDPLTFYVAPKDGPPEPVAPVDADQLAQWAEETEIQPGAGALVPGGAYRVNLASHRRRELAEASLAEVRDAGYAAELAEASVGGETWYRTAVPGFASVEEARGFAARIGDVPGAAGAWVQRAR